MDILYWILALVAGILCGRASVRREPTKDEVQTNIELDRLREDIVYYKKLTRNLVDENTELRKKQNGN